jgi:signal transduction histidine kinase/CheY-like chemotaxis protein
VTVLSASERLTAVLRAAQYLCNLSLLQDPWAELAQVLKGFFKCDLVLIVRPGEDGELLIVHAFTGSVLAPILLGLVRDEVRAVLESGFLGSQRLTDPELSLAFLPLPRDRRIGAVAIIGQAGPASLGKEDLEILLALGGLFGNVVARTETERELREYQQNLEGLIQRRTAELEMTNARLVHESAERLRAEEERQRAETTLQQDHKMESLGSLAGGVAHDMNNVLGAILSLASAHLTLQPKDGLTYSALATIRDAAIRGAEMVKRLLNFARQGPIESLPMDLNALLLEEARLLERTTLARIRLDLELAPDLRLIYGDASALTHVFMNLCVNAVDAMEAGGRLTLKTCNLAKAMVEVTVQDDGCGMPKEVLDRALDPYFTTKGVGKGTGLGLALVFNAVKAHGGQMEILSQPGEGTQVKLRFPACVTEDLGLLAPVQARSEAGTRTLNVLLVDDDDLIRKSTGMLVEMLGHAVTLTSSGEEAVALLEQGLRPEVVILDMNMPGLGGKGTLPHLRRWCPEVPVLLATGRVGDEAMELIGAYPFVTLLPKPFSMEELQKRLEGVASLG